MEKRILELALETLEEQRATIDTEIATIRARISGTGRTGAGLALAPAAARGRTMSDAQRKAVSQRMTAYWAARRAQTATPKSRRKSAAAKKASERMKAYWAKKKAAAAQGPPAK